ncbi:uncharacterized protein [Ptychodera flava]|uniref:uncharacterized protein n=1 Tax=Ptychodera flava TaxID=63121 RepID=UPI00396A680F
MRLEAVVVIVLIICGSVLDVINSQDTRLDERLANGYQVYGELGGDGKRYSALVNRQRRYLDDESRFKRVKKSSDVDRFDRLMDNDLEKELDEEATLRRHLESRLKQRNSGRGRSGMFGPFGITHDRPPPSFLGDYELADRQFKESGFSALFTEWSKWSGCNVTCGNGHQSRSRECDIGVINCPKSALLERRLCHVIHCANTTIAFIVVICVLSSIVIGGTVMFVSLIRAKGGWRKLFSVDPEAKKEAAKRKPGDAVPPPPPPTSDRPKLTGPQSDKRDGSSVYSTIRSDHGSEEDLYIDPYEDVPVPDSSRRESVIPEYSPPPTPDKRGKSGRGIGHKEPLYEVPHSPSEFEGDADHVYDTPHSAEEDLYLEVEAS